jgi:predicted nuclease of predicted toxin-antitoxin system
MAGWIMEQFGVEAKALREIGLRDAEDGEIYQAARQSNIVIITKDSDFVDLLSRYGQPPQILWLTCGNTSNAKLKEILSKALPKAIELLSQGEAIVEISDTLGE